MKKRILFVVRFILSFPALLGILIYKYAISPFTPASCRHYPTCSSYAHEAIQRHGIIRGSLMGSSRILHCHPWGTKGYDPVPKFIFPIIYKGKRCPFNLNDALEQQSES